MNIKKSAYFFMILIFSITFFTQVVLAQPSKNNAEVFLANEMDYTIQAQQSINNPSNNERRDLDTDPLTGQPWSGAEQLIRLSVQESKKAQLNQADFLASEFDYITKVEMTAQTAQKSDGNEENIDPMSGKNWDEIEAEIQ